jgi:hypothetical protein
MRQALAESGLTGVTLDVSSPDYFVLERRGETDPASWVSVRDQYR